MVPGSPLRCIKQTASYKFIRPPFRPRADSMRGDVMGRISRMIDKGLEFLIMGVNGGFLILLTTVTFIEVFTRYIWGFSTSQVSSWCVFFLMWISFSTIGIVLKEKKHIAMGTLLEHFTNSGKIKAGIYLNIFINVTLIIFSIIFSYLGFIIVTNAKATGYNTTIDFVPYYWVWYLALPVGTLSLLAYATRDMVHDISRLVDLKSRRTAPNKFDQRR
jgi:TRAP-type C4-dicarboxylate transport system permease small subunit